MSDELQQNGGGDLEALAAEARDVEAQIIRGFNAETVTRWHIAKYLHRFLEDRMYERLDYESERDWFASPHVPTTWKRSTALGVLAVYKALVVERKVDPMELEGIDVRKLQDGLKLLGQGKVTAAELISDAKALGRRDMRIRYTVEGPDAPIDPSREPARVECPTCGQWTDADKLNDEERTAA